MNTNAFAKSPIRLLVVDDERPHRELLQEIFEGDGFTVEMACDGVEAMERINQNSYDVVLLDNNMPRMTGLEVCRAIRAEPLHQLLPVIMVTALNSTLDLRRGLDAGATDFIGKPYSPLELEARVRSAAARKRATDQLDNAESILFALAHMVEARDKWTGDHCARLAHVAMVFGKSLGANHEDIDCLRKGGVLHDIGKLAIPDTILLKNGPLNDEEREIMQRHSVIGAELCRDLATMQSTAEIIRHHHERWDGNGYPDRLKGEEIPLLARIFHIVDIYDALISERPYKKAMPLDKVIMILEEEGSKGGSDPALIQSFIAILRQAPNSFALPAFMENGSIAPVFRRLEQMGVLRNTRFSTTSFHEPALEPSVTQIV